ncbi:MAG: lipid-A-disaccharide synthase [Saprospiraceae bacterium]|nr:lipid-A-disaccharide synthase [Saprospiraceae bacterium]
MKYYLIAGEASGDLHGSNLIKHLKLRDSNGTYRAWGGDKMEAVGAVIVQHFRNLAFMGFAEVLRNIRKIIGFLSLCKKDILDFKPDVLILIDYPGFNLRIAKWAKRQHIKVVYYITPQVWAWHKSRVHDLGKNTDLLLVILPFEPAFFYKYGYKSIYVGHPLLDAIGGFQPDDSIFHQFDQTYPVLAILPGSRKQEIQTMLPVMLEACAGLPYQFAIAGAPAIDDILYQNFIDKYAHLPKPKIIRNQTYSLLSKSKFALVSSGTATLETALFEVPQIVCYKGSIISFQIAKRLIDLKFISLVNLISEKEVVRELIQNDLTAENIRRELFNLESNCETIKSDYRILRKLLGNEGASSRAAEEIQKLLQ